MSLTMRYILILLTLALDFLSKGKITLLLKRETF
jgi:hypothetical protein